MGNRTFAKGLGFLTTALGVVALAALSPSARADNFQSSVEKFQSDSNYGPEIAVLGEGYDRTGKLEVAGGGTYSPFSSLIKDYSFDASLTYHISRRHSIEPIWFGKYFSSLGPFSRKEFRDNSDVSDANKNSQTLEVPKQTFAASYFFNPYYAKMHITERTVTHFDVMLGLGGGVVQTSNITIAGAKAAGGESRPAVALTAGIRFLFPSRFALRAELRDFIYQSRNIGKEAFNHSLQITLAGSIFFGAFPD